MDLIALLARAPSWLRVTLSVLVSLWGAATVLAAAFRAVPEERYRALESAWPRLGHLARAARKFGTDVIPFVGALIAAVVGARSKDGAQ